jgi:hypothetical protein
MELPGKAFAPVRCCPALRGQAFAPVQLLGALLEALWK